MMGVMFDFGISWFKSDTKKVEKYLHEAGR
jgi:hypothetical protein